MVYVPAERIAQRVYVSGVNIHAGVHELDLAGVLVHPDQTPAASWAAPSITSSQTSGTAARSIRLPTMTVTPT